MEPKFLPGVVDPAFKTGKTASTVIVKGDLLYEDRSISGGGLLKPCTSSAGTTINVIGVATQDVASAGTSCEYRPFIGIGLDEIEMECANAVNVDQLGKCHLLSNAQTVNNTSTTSAAAGGIFHALRLGSTSTRLVGEIIRSGQVTA